MTVATLPTAEIAWSEANLAYLEAELEGLRHLLRSTVERLETPEPLAGRRSAPPGPRETARRHLETLRDRGQEPALDALCRRFGLDDLERRIVLLALAPRLDGSFRPLFGRLQGRTGDGAPTCELAVELFCADTAERALGWRCFDAHAPLCYFRILTGEDRLGADLPLRLDERVAAYLLGSTALDGRVLASLRPVPEGRATPSHEELAGRLGSWLERQLGAGAWPRVDLVGPEDSGRSTVALRACRQIGLRLEGLDRARLADGSIEVPLLERESALGQLAYYLDLTEVTAGDAEAAAERAAVDHLATRLKAPLILAGTAPVASGAMLVLQVSPPDAAERLGLWRSVGETLTLAPDLSMEPLAQQFLFGPRSISRAVHDARRVAELRGGDEVVRPEDLWEACRLRTAAPMSGLARRLPTPFSWPDIILPPDKERILRDLAAQVRNRRTVYEEWGFGEKVSQARGIGALFSGPSGTGKTMAAQVLAGELNLDLYRIDLASVVSKYIGETEKNLSRIFDAAERTGAVLFFDEADALFGKRSEVRDSHDRYANIQVDYLLQRMEEYAGLVVLATNMKSHLDSAFMRRLRFAVEFPFPDRKLRTEIWRRGFPDTAPTDAIDFEGLGSLEMPGGSIRNVVVNAAFLAAEEGRPIGMDHLRLAAEREHAKEGKLAPRVPRPSAIPSTSPSP